MTVAKQGEAIVQVKDPDPLPRSETEIERVKIRDLHNRVLSAF